MRLARLSDVHGNVIALAAVLADIALQGRVDGYWVLCDPAGGYIIRHVLGRASSDAAP